MGESTFFGIQLERHVNDMDDEFVLVHQKPKRARTPQDANTYQETFLVGAVIETLLVALKAAGAAFLALRDHLLIGML